MVCGTPGQIQPKKTARLTSYKVQNASSTYPPTHHTMSTKTTAPMTSKKNLTRFDYEKSAFEGWRLCLSKTGTTFTRYFPDKKFEGSAKKSLAAAEKTLAELKTLIAGSKLVDGKLGAATIKKAGKLLADAV